MMAHWKLNFLVMATLFAMLLEVEANLTDDCRELSVKIINGLPKDQVNNPYAVWKFANDYLGGNYPEVMKDWKFMIDGPQNCDDGYNVRFEYIAHCRPEDWYGLTTLSEATKNYARRCMSSENIWQQINSRLDVTEASNPFADFEKFIDRISIVDYIHKKTTGSAKPTTAEYRKSMIVKAVLKQAPKNLDNDQLYVYLTEHLYQPCFKLVEKLDGPIYWMKKPSQYLGGFDEFVWSLDERTQNYILRYFFCKDLGDKVWTVENTQRILAAMATSS